MPICAHSASAQVTSATATADWTHIVPLRGVPAGRSIRWPSLARRGETLFVAANTVPVDGRSAVGDRPAILVASPGTALTMPAGHAYKYPRVIVDSLHTLHLLWGEAPGEASHSPRWSSRVTALMHAALGPRGWTTPDTVITGEMLAWSADEADAVALAGSRIGVVLPVVAMNGTRVLTYIAFDGRLWRRHELARGASYATLAVPDLTRLSLAYIGYDSLTRRAGAVLETESTDGGTTWSAPRTVSDAAAVTVAPRAIGRDGVTELVWGESSSHGANVERLAHATIDARNPPLAVWRSALDSGQELRFVAAAVSCATTALVESLDNSIGALRVVTDETTWRGADGTRTRLRPEFRGMANVAITASRDSLWLVATVIDSTAVSRTVVMQRAPCAR